MDNNIPRPNFCVDEAVIAIGNFGEHRGIITKALYATLSRDRKTGKLSTGWVYLLNTSAHDDDYASESILRKIPDGNGLSWEQLKANLNMESPLESLNINHKAST